MSPRLPGAPWAGYPPRGWTPPPRSAHARPHARPHARAHDPTLRAFVDTEVLVDEQVALALVRELARDASVVPVTAADVLGAIAVTTATIGPGLASGEELTLRDALVVRTALAAGCDVLLTRRVEDGTRYVGLDGRGGPDAAIGDGGLVVEDPFV